MVKIDELIMRINSLKITFLNMSTPENTELFTLKSPFHPHIHLRPQL
jgi:hypothetical protein